MINILFLSSAIEQNMIFCLQLRSIHLRLSLLFFCRKSRFLRSKTHILGSCPPPFLGLIPKIYRPFSSSLMLHLVCFSVPIIVVGGRLPGARKCFVVPLRGLSCHFHRCLAVCVCEEMVFYWIWFSPNMERSSSLHVPCFKMRTKVRSHLQNPNHVSST